MSKLIRAIYKFTRVADQHQFDKVIKFSLFHLLSKTKQTNLGGDIFFKNWFNQNFKNLQRTRDDLRFFKISDTDENGHGLRVPGRRLPAWKVRRPGTCLRTPKAPAGRRTWHSKFERKLRSPAAAGPHGPVGGKKPTRVPKPAEAGRSSQAAVWPAGRADRQHTRRRLELEGFEHRGTAAQQAPGPSLRAGSSESSTVNPRASTGAGAAVRRQAGLAGPSQTHMIRRIKMCKLELRFFSF